MSYRHCHEPSSEAGADSAPDWEVFGEMNGVVYEVVIVVVCMFGVCIRTIHRHLWGWKPPLLFVCLHTQLWAGLIILFGHNNAVIHIPELNHDLPRPKTARSQNIDTEFRKWRRLLEFTWFKGRTTSWYQFFEIWFTPLLLPGLSWRHKLDNVITARQKPINPLRSPTGATYHKSTSFNNFNFQKLQPSFS